MPHITQHIELSNIDCDEHWFEEEDANNLVYLMFNNQNHSKLIQNKPIAAKFYIHT